MFSRYSGPQTMHLNSVILYHVLILGLMSMADGE